MLFIVGLRLPLTELHRQLANYLGLFVSQITPNMWRIFIGVEVIWDQLSGGNRRLTPEFYYYRPQQIHLSKGIYHFLAGKPSFKLVSDMPDSNRNCKNRYFFVQGMDWVCILEESDSIPDGFDNTWGVLIESGESSMSIFFYPVSSDYVTNLPPLICFQLKSVWK